MNGSLSFRIFKATARFMAADEVRAIKLRTLHFTMNAMLLGGREAPLL